jgi:hypothetical protein
LLRYFLDAHPDLCCPAETNIAAMFDAIRFAAGVVLPPDSTGDVAAYDICRLTARELFKPYLQRENKRRWCDKSLSSIDTAESLARIFPDARFICLYRDFRDVVASTLEACPFGVAGYGLDPYVQDTPGNSVLAIARYWADKVETMLAFEAQHPHEACRVRYEDFVADPMDEFDRICRFVGATAAHGLTPTQVLHRTNVRGPQDYKIAYTRDVTTASVGRGWMVPTNILPEILVSRLDAASSALGYPSVAARSSSVETRRAPSPAPGGYVREPERPDDATARIVQRVVERLAGLNGDAAAATKTAEIRQVDGGTSWWLDLNAKRLDFTARPAEALVLLDQGTMEAIADGSLNPAVACRHNRFRIEAACNSGADVTIESLAALGDVVLGLLAPG